MTTEEMGLRTFTKNNQWWLRCDVLRQVNGDGCVGQRAIMMKQKIYGDRPWRETNRWNSFTSYDEANHCNMIRKNQ